MNTLIDRIQLAIESDTFQRQKYSQHLTRYYNEASEIEKARINLCFVALCGMPLCDIIAVQQKADESRLTPTI